MKARRGKAKTGPEASKKQGQPEEKLTLDAGDSVEAAGEPGTDSGEEPERRGDSSAEEHGGDAGETFLISDPSKTVYKLLQRSDEDDELAFEDTENHLRISESDDSPQEDPVGSPDSPPTQNAPLEVKRPKKTLRSEPGKVASVAEKKKTVRSEPGKVASVAEKKKTVRSEPGKVASVAEKKKSVRSEPGKVASVAEKKKTNKKESQKMEEEEMARPSAKKDSLLDLILRGLEKHDDKKGVSVPTLKKFIIENDEKQRDWKRLMPGVKKALEVALENGHIIRPKGSEHNQGLQGRFKVNKKLNGKTKMQKKIAEADDAPPPKSRDMAPAPSRKKVAKRQLMTNAATILAESAVEGGKNPRKTSNKAKSTLPPGGASNGKSAGPPSATSQHKQRESNDDKAKGISVGKKGLIPPPARELTKGQKSRRSRTGDPSPMRLAKGEEPVKRSNSLAYRRGAKKRSKEF